MYCKYDKTTVANGQCETCKVGLCSFCGYVANGKRYCNEDWESVTPFKTVDMQMAVIRKAMRV